MRKPISVVLGLLVGCVDPDVPPSPDDGKEDAAPVEYFTVLSMQRDCIGVTCQEAMVSAVNRTLTTCPGGAQLQACLVHAIDWSETAFEETEIERITSRWLPYAPAAGNLRPLIVRGRLVKSALVVAEAWVAFEPETSVIGADRGIAVLMRYGSDDPTACDTDPRNQTWCPVEETKLNSTRRGSRLRLQPSATSDATEVANVAGLLRDGEQLIIVGAETDSVSRRVDAAYGQVPPGGFE